MAKPEAWRLDPARYPFSDTTETRFQDLDPLGHINNVAMAALFENGRIRFNRTLALSERRKSDERWLIASLAIDYVAEAHFPDPMQIASGIGAINLHSWTILSAAFQKGRCVATSDTTVVLTGPEGARALPDMLRAALTAQMIHAPDRAG